MAKSLYISEKPSVAQEFAKALKVELKKHDGYLEGENTIITWCVGHLVTMSYPDKYDASLKRWSLNTLPFLPKEFKYEIIPSASKQFDIVSQLMNRKDVLRIYVCTDSGREGEYIYRLVEQMANIDKSKERRRVWIDSQTEEEILRGIKEAKDISEYDNLSDAAYLRAKEDYLMGINFSRLLTLKYGNSVANYLKKDRAVISVGRVMTCVLGMIVRREREIRQFVKTPFYRIISTINFEGNTFDSEWRVSDTSKYKGIPELYKDNGFKTIEKANEVVGYLKEIEPVKALVSNIERKTEKKNPPLLYNLAELQNECSKLFKISPDNTLKIVQELYEKKLVTYPRTDARVLSTAVAKEIYKNIKGLQNISFAGEFAKEILEKQSYKSIVKSRYVNDKQITDHYAIIPTGQGFNNLNSLSDTSKKVYEIIVRRFLSIFYPPAEYLKVNLALLIRTESFVTNIKTIKSEGYLKVAKTSFGNASNEANGDLQLSELFKKLKKDMLLDVDDITIKEGETTPPKRYNSGSIILAMENAGQLIEDEELRAQIKGSGIGTSATRAEILKKLINNEYINLNKKTQILTPTLLGEMIFDVVDASIKSLLNPDLTASWEKGLTYVANGEITSDEYMEKLEKFITTRTNGVLMLNNQYQLRDKYDTAARYYKK